MWKKLLSLLKGRKGVASQNDGRESAENKVGNVLKDNSKPMFSKLFEDEYAFLSFAQGELRKGRYLVSQSKFLEARDVLKPLVTIVKASLVANHESERREKLLDIVEGSTIAAYCYIEEGKYSNAYDLLEDARKYAEDLTLLASNLKGTLTLIVQMYCMHLNCCQILGKESEKERIREKVESVIAILSSCVSDSPIYDKIQIMERICDYLDGLITMKAYNDACIIFSHALFSINWEELNDYSLKHSYAVLFGRYVGCLLNSSSKDMKDCKQKCDSEIEMYKCLLEEKNSVQAKMDLAVAYSHKANYYLLAQDYPNFVALHVRKIALLADAIKGNVAIEGLDYNKRLSDSIVISIKNCINEFGEVDRKNVNYYKAIFDSTKNINNFYLVNSELLAYINLIAGELFKYIYDKDFFIAQDCLITRFTSLLYLLDSYGPEKDVVKDFLDTIVYAQPFIKDNEKRINDELRELWIKSYSKAKEVMDFV